MAQRNHQYHDDGVLFHLYGQIGPEVVLELQRQLYDKPATDQGLRFAKFFGRWSEASPLELLVELRHTYEERIRQGNWLDNDKPVRTEPVLDWLRPPQQVGAPSLRDGGRDPATNEFRNIGDATCLEAAANRMKNLAKARMNARFGADVELKHATFKLSLVSRLLTGIGLPHPTENGFLFHPTLAVPYVRGTALKQVARDWAEEEEQLNKDELAHIFGGRDSKGKDKGAGCIAFLDALPCKPVTLTAEQITSHYGPYYQNANPATGQRAPQGSSNADFYEPADWHEPNPVTLLAVDADFDETLPFQFAILPLKRAIAGDVSKAARWLQEGLKFYGVGARTTLGFGRFLSNTELADQQPLAVGDRVEIVRCEKDPAYVGRIGIINKILDTPGRPVQVTPADDKGRLRGTFPPDDLKRLPRQAGGS